MKVTTGEAVLQLTIATGHSDRTTPLVDGRVKPEGVSVTWLRLREEEIFWRMLRHLEFDASELSLAGYTIRRDRGIDDLVAIPVFPSRMFRHSCIYVRDAAGIGRPEDLNGRRVGVPDFQMTAAVWARGILEDEYGVATRSIEWIQGGLEEPGRRPIEPSQPDGVSLAAVPDGTTLSAMLADGKIDALITPREPSVYGTRGGVRRLFADPWSVERDYFKRTGIFPIMHLVAIRRTLVDSHPWLPQTLAKAFLAAKQLTEATLLRPTGALPIELPFLYAHVEETLALMGEDYWPYGVARNRKTLDTFFRYAHSQGLISATPSIDSFFPESTRVVSRI